MIPGGAKGLSWFSISSTQLCYFWEIKICKCVRDECTKDIFPEDRWNAHQKVSVWRYPTGLRCSHPHSQASQEPVFPPDKRGSRWADNSPGNPSETPSASRQNYLPREAPLQPCTLSALLLMGNSCSWGMEKQNWKRVWGGEKEPFRTFRSSVKQGWGGST